MSKREQLEKAIAMQENLRGTMPDAVIDAAIDAIRQQLALLEPAKPAESQRKQITILFADVRGFTAMSETMDAEDVTEIMNLLWQRLDGAIADHGGDIDKHMGDAVMALWGIDSAREDDPARAIRAALEMQAELAVYREEQQIDLAMRIGLSTGPVLLAEVGTTREFTAMGDTVNLASRLEHAAPVGGILISRDTYRHVQGIFDVEELAPMAIKGKVEPVQVYSVQRAKPRAFRKGTRGLEGIETRMIGRESELIRLQGALRTVIEKEECRVVTVVGDAGVGKSRLLYEFDIWAEVQPDIYTFFKGRASLGIQNRPYGLIRDLLFFRFQILDSDRVGTVREKLELGIGEALGRDQGEMKAHFIGQLLGLDFSDSPYLKDVREEAKQLHDRALTYMVEYFRNMAAEYPVLILLEDLHWADDSSLDIFNRLALAMQDRPLLVLCATRSTLFDRRPHWGEGHDFYSRLPLQPLSKQDSDRLVDELLQKTGQVPEALRQLAVSRAEGNPFYVEEMIKMLIDDGVIVKGEERWHIEPERLTTVRVPPTLTGVLQARLDSLPREERTVLQQASIVGRTFWDRAVAKVNRSEDEGVGEKDIPITLSGLRGKEMVFQRDESVFDDTGEYIFKHAVLRDVTYESVLKRVRRIYHGLVAEWLIETSGERESEYVGLIADHLELAGQADRSAIYLRRAGEQAEAQFANDEAVIYFSRALELTPVGDLEARFRLHLAREKVYHLQGARQPQAEDLATLEELARSLDDQQETTWRQVEVALRQARLADSTGDFDAGIDAARKAAELIQTGPVAVMKAEAETESGIYPADSQEAAAYMYWGGLLTSLGDYEAAADRLEKARAKASGLPRLEVNILRSLGIVLWFQGDTEAARRHFEQSLAICRENGDKEGEAKSLNNLGIVAWSQGDYAGAMVYYQQALDLHRLVGDWLGEGGTYNNLGILASAQGDADAAKRYYERAMIINHQVGDRAGEAGTLGNLGLVALNQEDYAPAVNYYEQALDIFRQVGDRGGEGYALTGLGVALLGRDQADKAAATFQAAADLRQALNVPHLVMESRAGLARARLRLGELAEAMALVEEILGHVKDNGLEGTEEPFRIYLTCFKVLQANGDARANEILTTAHEQLQAQAAKLLDEEQRRAFLGNVPVHREIIEAFEKPG